MSIRAEETNLDTTKINDTLAGLEAQRVNLEARIAELSTNTGDTWADIKSGIEGAIEELEQAYEETEAWFEGES